MAESEIRAYSVLDRADVIALWQSCGLLRPWNDPDQDIALSTRTTTSDLLVADDGGRIVGSVMYGFDGHRGWVYYLAVSPDRMRSGLGRRLMREAEIHIQELGGNKVQLMVRGENAAVRSFYEQVGYAQEDRIVMSRRLDPT